MKGEVCLTEPGCIVPVFFWLTGVNGRMRGSGTYDISTTDGLALGILFVERHFYVFDNMSN